MGSILNKFTDNSFFETLRHAKNYFASNVAIRGLGIISMPIMTRLLLPSDYGILNVFTSYNTILISILTLNCYVALGRYYYEEQDDLQEFFGTSIIFICSLLAIFFIIFYFSRQHLAALLNIPVHLVIYLVPMVLFYVFNSWYEQIYIPQSKSRQIAIRNMVSSYGGFVLSVALIYYLKKDRYMGQVYSMMIMGVIFTCYYLYALRSYIKPAFKMKAIKYSLDYSLPLIPYGISVVILAQIDRVIINKYSGPTDVGLFSLAFNIGSLLTLALSALSQAWTPKYFKIMKEENYAELDKDITIIMKILMVCAYFLILFGQEVGLLLAKSTFHSALFIVPIVVVGLVFYSYSTFYSWHVQFAKRNIYMTPIVGVAGLTNILLNILLVPKFGYVAAAFASSVSYLVMLIMSVVITRKVLKIYATPILQAGKPFFIMIPFIMASYGLVACNFNIIANIGLKSCLFILFASIIFYSYLLRIYQSFDKLQDPIT